MMLQRRERLARLKLLDVVRLKANASQPVSSPWGGHVAAGSLGTIVDELSDGSFLVEFDSDGNEPGNVLTLPSEALTLHWSSPA
jgi:hypothetical protein